MLRFEMKKIFSKTVNQIALLVLAALIILASFLTINNVKYVNKDGTSSKGFVAARKLREAQNEWKGELTEEILRKVVSENHQIMEESGDLDAMPIEEANKVYAKTQGFVQIRELVNDALVGFGNYDYYKVDALDGSSDTGIYEKRIADLKEWLETEGEARGFIGEQKQYLIQKWEEVKTPFHYEYNAGWSTLLDNSHVLPTFLCALVAVMGFLVSGIFSDEFSNKADAVFFSARYGRNKAVLAKIGAGFLTATVVYWGAILTYTGIVLGVLGFSGGNVSVQVVAWEYVYNLTFLQEWILAACGGYVGCLIILGIAMFVSARTRSSVLAIAAAFILSCVPVFLGRIPMLNGMINFFPDILLRITEELKVDDFLIYTIGGKTMGLFEFLIPMYLLVYLLLQPVLYQVYKRTEVK